MYQVVLGIQCINIIALFAECWVIFKGLKGKLHFYLLLSCVSTLVNNIGYLLELTSRTEEAYFTALRLAYLGKVWTCFTLFLFLVELVRVRLPRFIRDILALLSAIVYVIVLTTRETGLYYSSMQFDLDGDLPVFVHKNGIVHTLWMVLIGAYCVAGLVILITAFLKENNKIARKRILMVILAVMTEGVFAIVDMLSLFPALEKVYDLSMLAFPVGALFIFIAIFRYNLLDTENLAREYVIDELSEGIIATDDQGEIRFFNKPALVLFPDLESRPRETIERLRQSIEKAEPIKLGDRIYSPEKNILYEKKKNAGTIYSIIDDTDHYHYLEELKEQKSIADRANKAKSSFLANMSHEIRTPINAVLGMDEMILRESREKDTLAYAADIQTAGRTLLSLINDILDFSKIEEGRMEIIPTQYELSSVIGDLVNMVRGRASKKGLIFKVGVETAIPNLLYGDEIRIKQIVINLLTNAVKYTETGEIVLRVSCEKVSESEIALHFHVSDTGIGMKEEDLEKLFAPFSRIEEERNRSIEGTGLGMSIVKQLLALMDSHLDVKSTYGVGSEFSFAIRQKVEKWDPIGEFSGRYESQGTKRDAYHELLHAPEATILVVDDTEVNLKVIRNLLKRTQIRVDTAGSGKDAISMAGKTAYDMIFIDHLMPEMDGFETLHYLKKEAKGRPVCIALTANAVSGAREMYLKEGFNDYLSKPVEGKLLEEMLREYLPREKQIDHAAETAPAAGQEQAPEQENTVTIPEWLKKIPEIHVEKGITNCGSEEDYLSVLGTFHQTAPLNADEIERLYREGDIGNYTIKVHALKSAARIVGADELSELAKDLEAAGKSDDMEMIRSYTDRLLELYRKLDGELAQLDEEEEKGQELTAGERKEAFTTIMEIAGSMDFGMLEDLLRELKKYQLSAEDKEALQEMDRMLLELNWDGIADIAKTALVRS